MKNIQIIHSKSGRLVATIPVVLGGQNYAPTAKDYEDEAWQCAVADGSVDPDRRDEYTITIIDARASSGS
jgi:hypothetical protein